MFQITKSRKRFFSFHKSFNNSLCTYRNIPVNVQVSRPSLRDLSHVFTLLRVEKQSWGHKFVNLGREEFMRPWNRKIEKTGYQKNSSETTLRGGNRPHRPPPYGSATALETPWPLDYNVE